MHPSNQNQFNAYQAMMMSSSQTPAPPLPTMPFSAPLMPFPFAPPIAPTTAPIPTMPSPTLNATATWAEFKSPDGRTYYFNSQTKQSSWEKPEELKSETERLLANC